MKGRDKKKEQKKEKATGAQAKVPTEYQREKSSKQDTSLHIK